MRGRMVGMGYCIYITRANDWLNSAETPISDSEWRAVVESDPCLSFNSADYSIADLPGSESSRIHPVEWSGAADDNCLWCERGAIKCKNPSELWISKMVELAALLNARVLGEANEVYR